MGSSSSSFMAVLPSAAIAPPQEDVAEKSGRLRGQAQHRAPRGFAGMIAALERLGGLE